MSKIFSILDGFTRAYPLIIIFHTFLNGVIHNNGDELRFSIFLLTADIFNHFIKTFVFRPLFGNKKIPLLGYGTRPQNMNCGLFINNKESTSYGLPSGHSQIAWLFTTYKILNLDPKKKYTKEQIQRQWKKIIAKVHPDISPDCQKIASIVNEARDTILKNDFS